MARFSFEDAMMLSSDAFSKLSFQEKQSAVSAIAREARERVNDLRNLEKDSGIKSPSLASFEKWRDESGKGNYSARYKSEDELIDEMAAAKEFLNNATSTVEGTKDYFDTMAEELGIEGLSGKELSDFGETFRKAEEWYKEQGLHVPSGVTRDNIKKIVNSQLSNWSIDNPEGGDINWEQVLEEITTGQFPELRI